MKIGNPGQEHDEKPTQRLRLLVSRRQEDLKDRFRHEIQIVEEDDVVMQVRLKHKYRLLGLHF